MKLLLYCGAVLLWTGVGYAQADPPEISFEVASVKAAPAMSFREILDRRILMGEKIDAAQAVFGRRTVAALVARSYGVESYQVYDPRRQATAEYDIAAKLPAGSTVDQVPRMLQSLLADRFKLALHRETREFDVYLLSVGLDGPKFPKSEEDDQDRPVTMQTLGQRASVIMGRPVLDQTGLKGTYKIRFDSLVTKVRETLIAADRGETNDRGVSAVMQFVQKLGLKLEPRKTPLPVLVIDHVEKTPAEN